MIKNREKSDNKYIKKDKGRRDFDSERKVNVKREKKERKEEEKEKKIILLL